MLSAASTSATIDGDEDSAVISQPAPTSCIQVPMFETMVRDPETAKERIPQRAPRGLFRFWQRRRSGKAQMARSSRRLPACSQCRHPGIEPRMISFTASSSASSSI